MLVVMLEQTSYGGIKAGQCVGDTVASMVDGCVWVKSVVCLAH